jgi:STAS domain
VKIARKITRDFFRVSVDMLPAVANPEADGRAAGSRRTQQSTVLELQAVVVALEAQMTVDGLYPDADWLRISPLTGSTGLCLSGEADMHTAEMLRKTLAELVPPDAAEIHLQLASLEFIDVAAARQLVALAERPAPSRVILHQPPAVLMWLISLLWPDSLIRFFVPGGPAE